MSDVSFHSRPLRRPSAGSVVVGVLGACGALALAYTAHSDGRPITAALLALFGVTIAGAVLGVRAGVITGIAASAGYNYLLTDPILKFTFPSADDLVPIIALNVTAIASGLIAGRLRDRAVAAERLNLLVAQLLTFSEALQRAVTLADIEGVAREYFGAGPSVELFVEAAGKLQPASPSAVRAAAAEELWESQASEASSETYLAWVLASAEKRIGVILVEVVDGQPFRTDIKSFLPLLALAVQRARLASEISEADAIRRSEKFKTALLSSVSHDFRTPLAAITAAATGLNRFGNDFDDSTRDELLLTIQEQCERLDRLTTNLLNIGRIEGGLDVEKMQVIDAVEVLGSALAKVRRLHPHHQFAKDFQPLGASVRADEALLEQVFVNVLENAAVHTRRGTKVRVSSRTSDGSLSIAIEDDGAGISEGDRVLVFDRFFQGKGGLQSGSGLGLSIAKGFTECIGGTISAKSAAAPLTGAQIEITLPLART